MTGYYDYVLGAIPLALLGGTGLFNVAGVSVTTAIPLAATVAVLVIGHALFVNAPTDGVAASGHASAHHGPVNAD
jgi:hypothetical protein